MKIIAPSKNYDILAKTIQPIDDLTIMQLAQLAFSCKRNIEREDIRNIIYVSKYKPNNLESKERALELELDRLSQNNNIKTNNQNKEYKWVKINTANLGEVSYRFYIAPNPENLHEIVHRLAEMFILKNVPVEFKYQLTTGMYQCDRIIIYSDLQNKELVEQAIQLVYKTSPILFSNCERSIAWLYKTKVPGVYLAPETPSVAYSNKFADAILEARATFNFLYGITGSNAKIKLYGEEASKAIEYMKILICSILFRKGLLLARDNRLFLINDQAIRAFYEYNTGILKHDNLDSKGYYEVQFLPTEEGRKVLLENFYSVSKIEQQVGVVTKHLTLEQWHEERREKYPHFYPSTNSDGEFGSK